MAEKYTTDPILIGEGRLSFVYAFERAKDENGKESKYETTLLLPPGFNTAPLLAMLWDAWHLRWTKDQKKWPVGATVRTPDKVIRDCRERAKYTGYEEGWHFVSARTDYEPLVRDRTRAKVMEQDGKMRFPRLGKNDSDEVYAGRWAHISANAYTFQNKTTGVTLGLEGILLGRHDTRFAGGGSRADKSFDDVAEEITESALD
jgi:hypothetical protein